MIKPSAKAEIEQWCLNQKMGKKKKKANLQPRGLTDTQKRRL